MPNIIINNRKFTLFSEQNCEEDFIVLYPFCASKTDELTLTAGVIVSLIESKPSGWSWVTNVDVGAGWFPSQYLEPLNSSLKRNKTKIECNVGILSRILLNSFFNRFLRRHLLVKFWLIFYHMTFTGGSYEIALRLRWFRLCSTLTLHTLKQHMQSYLAFSLFTCLLVYYSLFTCLLVYLFTCLLVYLFTCLLVYLFTCLLVYLFTCLLVYYLFTTDLLVYLKV